MTNFYDQSAPHRARDIVSELLGQQSRSEIWLDYDNRQFATAEAAADFHIRCAAEAASDLWTPVTEDERRELIRAIEASRPE